MGGGKTPKDTVWRRYDITDGPNHATSPRSYHSSHGNNFRLFHRHQCHVSVMVLQGYKFTHQKSRSLESGHRRQGVWVPLEYKVYAGPITWILSFCAYKAGFCKDSHMPFVVYARCINNIEIAIYR